LIGDRWVDIAAGRAAGVHTVLLGNPYGWAPTSAGSPPADLVPDHREDSFASCVECILVHHCGAGGIRGASRQQRESR
jgi:hypothetical protein